MTAFITSDVLEIEVVRTGTKLVDPHGYFNCEVAAECSGIRSFIALLAISTVFSALAMRGVWKRAVMIVLAVPIALVCNVLRLITIILAATAFRSERAGEFVHELLWVCDVFDRDRGAAGGGTVAGRKAAGRIAMKGGKWVIIGLALGMMGATAGWLGELRERVKLGPPGVKADAAALALYGANGRPLTPREVVLPAKVSGYGSVEEGPRRENCRGCRRTRLLGGDSTRTTGLVWW